MNLLEHLEQAIKDAIVASLPSEVFVLFQEAGEYEDHCRQVLGIFPKESFGRVAAEEYVSRQIGHPYQDADTGDLERSFAFFEDEKIVLAFENMKDRDDVVVLVKMTSRKLAEDQSLINGF